mmetsp:Transcript_56757/g.65029  ORF Transcript_56757/g.65029 Transcript_56757/m.65029 type:complete len:190 (+) Transcript_56757:23-592(+)
MNFVKSLCKDIFDQCLATLGRSKSTTEKHEYSNVNPNPNDENIHQADDEESFSAWPSKNNSTSQHPTTSPSSMNTSSASTQHSRNTDRNNKHASIELESKPSKPVLIGNLDEEGVLSKKIEMNADHDEEDLFAKMGLNSTPASFKINKPGIDAKKTEKSTTNKMALDKFKMDEELQPEAGGWADDDINI